MAKSFNFALKIKRGCREGGTCEVLRPCHPQKIWNVHHCRSPFCLRPSGYMSYSGPVPIGSGDLLSLPCKPKRFFLIAVPASNQVISLRK